MPISESAGTFQPHQVELLQKTFNGIVQEPWFARSMENDRVFAGIVVKSYRDGMTNEAILSRYVRTIARQRFSKENAGSGN